MRFKKLTPTATTPTRGTPGAAGLDLYSDTECLLVNYATTMVGTGVAVEIPEGYVGLVTVRSSLGKAGVSLVNAVGVIDSDYRGEIMLALIYSASVGGHYVHRGSRIGQLVVVPAPLFDLQEVDELSETTRGTGGFGSTGR
jgi:dUTP pyrophosphatase